MLSVSAARVSRNVARARYKDRCSNMAMSDRTLSRGNKFIQLVVLLELSCCMTACSPALAALETGAQAYSENNNSKTMSSASNFPSSGNQYGSTYHSEIASLWNDLSLLSDTASTLISSDNRSAIQAPLITSNGSLDLLTAINSTNAQEDEDQSLMLGVIIANIIIFVIGFCGNSLVILVILKFTKIETVTDIYILNLAFADLMFLFGLIFLIITMAIDHWIFGNLMCKLYMASTSLNQFASSLLLVVMSFDRFLAVCHPIYAQRFRRLGRAKVICLCIWIVCLILMTPIFAFAKTNKDLTCAIFWPEYKSFNCEIAFTMYSFAIGFAVPLLLIAGFYICVIRKLRIAASGPINLGSRRSRSRETTNKRIEHLVIGIICTYTICWLPYWTSQLCVSFTTSLERSPIDGFYPFVLVATCLSYTNSALNPILYAFLSDNFKRRCSDVFRSMLSLKWCPHAPSNESHSTAATALYEPSEANTCLRPESRQTVILNESVRLVTSPSQLTDVITSDLCNNNVRHNNNINNIHNNSNSNLSRGINHQQLDIAASNSSSNNNNSSISNRQISENLTNNYTHCYISQNNCTLPSHSVEPACHDGNCNETSLTHQNGDGNHLAAQLEHRKKNVVFNMGTVVVQKTSTNEPESMIGDHKTLQVSNGKQQCLEAV